MSEINQILKFKGSWRTYQERVLRNANRYLDDGNLHIVAAPGSGKTTLGIELIARVNKPTLILAPSIVIREQWEQRIVEAFLNEGLNARDYISQDLKNPSIITIATYQALHSAMTNFAGTITENDLDGEEDESSETSDVENGDGVDADDTAKTSEVVDYSDFDLINKLKEMGVETICLDECHHLRSEWWKALEEFKGAMGEMITIALTATPPYDSTLAMWKRYINMCGEIDEEIMIPELVKEGSLCPHQDYVYFSYPTREEQKSIREFEDRRDKLIDELMSDSQLPGIIQMHPYLNGLESDDVILDNPKYLASLLIYLNQVGKPVPERHLTLLGVKSLPNMEPKWMEVLLQQLLYDDVDRFNCDKAYQENLIKRLKSDGFIERRKVVITNSSKIEKMIANSKGKADSVVTIAKSEFESLGSELRMVILTDYIRKEYIKKLGAPDGDKTPMLGVIPFFERIREEFKYESVKPKLGVLCGSVVIVPADSKDRICELLGDKAVAFTSIGQLSQSDFVQVSVAGNQHLLTSVITEIFKEGYINILVGTKSLLGEGWDSPCINSLILASFVGSFMLSNQMRGRAIRVMKDNPNKTSNIWHLVCLKSERVKEGEKEEERVTESNDDFKMLERRMDHFLGLHYTENSIENGIRRMSVIEYPLTKARVKATNEKMLKLSKQRDLLKERWENALVVFEHPEIVDETIVSDEFVTVAIFQEGVKEFIISLVMVVMSGIMSGAMENSPAGLLLAFLVLGIFYMYSAVPKLFMAFSPYRRLKSIANQILKALKEQDLLKETACEVEVIDETPTLHGAFLRGGTGRDKNLFAKCVAEFLGEIDNQRYIMVEKGLKSGMNSYYAVPEVFSKNKESATLFANCMKKYLKKYNLYYTRNAEGRKFLLKGRVHAFANRDERIMSNKKVKSALE